MKPATIVCCSLLIAGAIVSMAPGRGVVPIDQPTPPPCAADGTCYPKENEWGYYPSRWRRWPGVDGEPDEVEPTPAEQLGPDLEPYETPSAEEEDEQAPPATTKRTDADLPPLPEGQPQQPQQPQQPTEGGAAPQGPADAAAPSRPGTEMPPTAPGYDSPFPSLDPQNLESPNGPGSPSPLDSPSSLDSSSPLSSSPEGQPGDHDPPPTPPFAARSPDDVDDGKAVDSPRAVQPGQQQAGKNDPPPTVPWAYRSVSL